MRGWQATADVVRAQKQSMSDKKIELNRRRVLGGIVTLGGAAAAAGAGTFAYFSDSESSTDNEVVAGTMDLNDPTNGQISVSNIAPGETVPSGGGTTTISATYDASSTLDAEGDFSSSLSEPSEPSEPSTSTNQSASDFASQLTVTTAELTRNGSVETDLTTSPQSVSTAADLGGLSVDDGFGTIAPGDTIGLRLGLTFDSGAGNAYQADGVSIDATFTAEQPSAD